MNDNGEGQTGAFRRQERLLHSVLFSLIGLGGPLLAAVFAIPLLLQELGHARFGLLTLVWALVSYLGLFVLGIGRAVTQQVAIASADRNGCEIVLITCNGLVLSIVLGLAAAVAFLGLSEVGLALIHDIPDVSETRAACFAMAFTMPFVLTTAILRGALEGRLRFRSVNLIRLPLGIATFVIPLFLATSGYARLDHICYALATMRIVACFAHALLVWIEFEALNRRFKWSVSAMRRLMIAGGWMTVSSVVSPLMGYADRFMIGIMISAIAVAYYATPGEIVTKLWIVPGAVAAVLFPVFAGKRDHERSSDALLITLANSWLWVLLIPFVGALYLFAHEILSRWIDIPFANEGAPVLRVFAVGILINCMAHVPLTLLQGAGWYRMPALIHLVELPFFIVALLVVIPSWGIIGAAFVWFARMLVDSLLMVGACARLMRIPASSFVGLRTCGAVMLVCVLMVGGLFESVPIRIGWYLIFAIAPVCIVGALLFHAWHRDSPAAWSY